MSLSFISLLITLSSTALLILSASLPLQALALLLITGAIATIIATNISILLGIYTILIYASGLLVLLAYFVALTPDQTLNFPSRLTSLILAAVITLLSFQSWPFISSLHLCISTDSNVSAITILTPSSTSLLTIIALTLVLTIIAVVKVSSLSSGPIRPWSPN